MQAYEPSNASKRNVVVKKGNNELFDACGCQGKNTLQRNRTRSK